MDSRLNLDVDIDALERATGALQEADDSIAEQIPEEMILLANRLAAAARALVLTEPTFGVKQRGFRAELATGVHVEDDAGGADITTSVPNRNERNLPAETDDYLRGWRHPVFGHRDRWVNQSFSFSWFTAPMQRAQSDGTQALQNVLDQAASRIRDEVSG